MVGVNDYAIAREGLGDALEAIAQQAREFAALDAMIREDHPRPGDTRTCPGCGRPQHYTGAELGWCHDALVDTWHCTDPRKADSEMLKELMEETRCEGCGAITENRCWDCNRVFCMSCQRVHNRGKAGR